jgi:D-alanine-D-alanine ligase
MRIGVLMGGISAERDVSLNTGRGVLAALLESGYDAVGLDWTESIDLAELLRRERVQVVWNALHGTFGEDGSVQGLLECLRIPYTGAGVLASAVAMDKVLSKLLFEEGKIPTPPWKILRDAADAPAIARAWGYPVVVKPSREGSSVGVTIVHAESELSAAIQTARSCHGVTLIERYIPGAEVQVGVLDGVVLGTVEVRPAKEFYDYEAKYLRNDTQYLVPAPLSAAVDRAVRDASLHAYELIGCVGHTRVDCRVDPSGQVFVLEVNTLPGMTATSLLPKIARVAGMDYATLCVRILRSASLRA